jgi:hypothetical protein
VISEKTTGGINDHVPNTAFVNGTPPEIVPTVY